jgi:DNA-binding LacI/PurR family transcriptional regulator
MAVKLADIASQTNVSPAIVSRVLNNKPGVWASEATRQRILEVARELKYRPSAAGRALATGRSMRIGVSASDADWIHGRSGRSLQMRGLIDAAVASQYSVLVIPSPGERADAGQFEEWVEGGKCDGYCVFAEQGNAALYEYFRSENSPFVVIGNPGDAHLPQIDHDNYHYMYDATQWLAEQGHQRIGFVVPTPLGQDLPPHVRLMLRARSEAQRDFCGGDNPDLILRGSSEEDVIMGFVRRAKPTAVILYGMPRTVRWRTLFMRHGIRVPEDVVLLSHLDVAGLSDLERAHLAEGLAIQVYDPHLVGQKAGNALVEWINGTPPARDPVLIPSQMPVWWTGPMCVPPEYL